MTLFFLSHAGGSAKSYASFKRFLPKELNVVTMELSGRFTRSSEPLLRDIPSCAADLIEKHGALLAEDGYAIFGHSMGTLLAAELVRQAKEAGLGSPAFVFLSGRCAPDEKIKAFPGSENASDEEIISFFNSKGLSGGALPPIADEELIKKLNETLCADVRMAESYFLSPEELDFGCDIAVIYGSEDPMLAGADMGGWRRFTSGVCETFPMSGGHFYYKEHKEEVCELIRASLQIK